MNSKNIKKHLNAKLRDWISSIDDENIKTILKENVIIGRKIPVGTGVAPLSDFETSDSKEPTEEDLENL